MVCASRPGAFSYGVFISPQGLLLRPCKWNQGLQQHWYSRSVVRLPLSDPFRRQGHGYSVTIRSTQGNSVTIGSSWTRGLAVHPAGMSLPRSPLKFDPYQVVQRQ